MIIIDSPSVLAHVCRTVLDLEVGMAIWTNVYNHGHPVNNFNFGQEFLDIFKNLISELIYENFLSQILSRLRLLFL